MYFAPCQLLGALLVNVGCVGEVKHRVHNGEHLAEVKLVVVAAGMELGGSFTLVTLGEVIRLSYDLLLQS